MKADRIHSRGAFVCLVVVGWLALSARPAAGQARIDYARDVLPILSDKCYHCHGPDEQARQAELRLDRKEGAFRVQEGVTVVAPGKSAESELVRRTSSTDPDVVMPPADNIRKLTPQQIDTLKRWVEQGATWGTHWAFVAPRKIRPSVINDRAWPRGEIDRFVLAELEKEKLAPSPEADGVTLVRRVTLDLTGLPPTPAEVDAFIADKSPDAYEKLIDRLLASPRYGERMATDWLDLARYADTHGYQMDRYRAMWPWRDWVIRAFNQNLPFDQFVTWQLAGDLLHNATKDQRLATAFNRNHLQNEEGGVVAEEFRVAYVVDRVNTVGTAFLGLTFDCTRCHDHKFDPVTQRDYYSMFAFFQNIDESGQTSFFTDATPTPALLLSDEAQDAKLVKLRDDIAAKERELRGIGAQVTDALDAWLANKGDASADAEGMVARYAFDDPAATQPVNAVDAKHPATAIEAPKTVDGKLGKAAELNGENGFVFPGVGTFSRADPFSLGLWLKAASNAPRMVVAHKSRAPADAASKGYELLLENGRVAFGLHHFWPGNSIKVVTKQAIPIDQWTHVTVTYDGSSRAAGVRVFIDGIPAEIDVVRDGLTKDILYGGGEPDLAIGHRFRDNGFKAGAVDDFRIFNRALTILEIERIALRWRGSLRQLAVDQPEVVRDYYLATAHWPWRHAANELAALRRAENDLVTPIPEVMVMREMSTTKPAHVLTRGAYDAPGEVVSAATPAFLPPFPPAQPRNRLGLAKWLLDPGNPLTARVTVNRAWQQMFGRAIVETSENFGTQGAQPTHPELLDFLARDFLDTMHWDIKRLLKTIAMSATYRQSSRAPADLLVRDPANALLARGPSRRLTAEMLRDQALSVSGLLVDKLGGPSVKPYQPDGVWDVAMGRPTYDRDH
ncbi:MAG: DUF1549 domain-containing protein, partial [Tepidisphaeraceae bacterium]